MKTIAVGDLGEFWYGDYKEPFEQLEGAVPGYPKGAVLIEPGTEKLLCALCGKTASHLGNHVRSAHGLPAPEYKDQVGLLRGSSLVSEPVRQAMVANGRRRAAQADWSDWVASGQARRVGRATYGARNKRRPEALNKTGRCLVQIIEVARAVHREHGYVSYKRMRKAGIPQAAMQPYGGLRRIAQYAGIGHRAQVPKYHDEMLLTMLRELAVSLGRTPGDSDLKRYGLPSHQTYANHFGRYSVACERAGLISNLPTPIGHDDEVAILVGYATTGSVQRVATACHRGTASVRAVLGRYDVPMPGVNAPHASREAARTWAAEVARRVAGWPADKAAA